MVAWNTMEQEINNVCVHACVCVREYACVCVYVRDSNQLLQPVV